MEDNAKLIGSLFEQAAEYGKTSFELFKLNAIDKSSDVVSSIIPRYFVFVLIGIFMIFLNLGLALWFGEILGKTYLGFFVVAAFYGITAIIVHLFLQKWLKKLICNSIIKRLLK